MTVNTQWFVRYPNSFQTAARCLGQHVCSKKPCIQHKASNCYQSGSHHNRTIHGSAEHFVLLFSGMCWQSIYQIDLTLAELYLVLL